MNFSNKKLKSIDIDFVIYHGSCVDGFGSALAVKQFFTQNNIKKNITYHAGYFSNPPPNVENKNVLICDFSYNKETMLDLILSSKNLLIIDHHKSAESALKDIPDENKYFDINHSGAYLTWKYFFPDDDVPLLIKYIEDNDIWIKKMPYTCEVSSFIQSLPFEFNEYEKLLDDTYLNNTVIPVGCGMYKQNEYYIKQAVKKATPKFIMIDNKYYFVCFLNTSILKSEIGNKVFTEYTLCDFSAMYSINDFKKNETIFSLRSENNRTDVSIIASKFGGGGHRNAAGVLVNYVCNMLPCIEIHGSELYKQLSNIYFTNEFPFFQTNDNNENNELLYGVYLNSSNNKYEFGKYLLQSNKDILICENIAKIKNIDYNKEKNITYSLIWSYNQNNYDCILTCLNIETFNFFQNIITSKIYKDICKNKDQKNIKFKYFSKHFFINKN